MSQAGSDQKDNERKGKKGRSKEKGEDGNVNVHALFERRCCVRVNDGTKK
ncbi:MAG: hypothetical protein NPIRA04_26900 [Nitrospirales bacterium]|nr:MAG: hypothetical protein NPIRA04_26900 [Nitrospirales bacterium]